MAGIRIVAFIFGVAFIIGGIMGYLPFFLDADGNLFGYFHVDDVHNIVHIISGVIALLATATVAYSKVYFQIFGLIYGIVTVLGFVFAGDLYVMHVNMADNLLHLGIAIIALYMGFIFKTVQV